MAGNVSVNVGIAGYWVGAWPLSINCLRLSGISGTLLGGSGGAVIVGSVVTGSVVTGSVVTGSVVLVGVSVLLEVDDDVVDEVELLLSVEVDEVDELTPPLERFLAFTPDAADAEL
jgi:hypothetical protein